MQIGPNLFATYLTSIRLKSQFISDLTSIGVFATAICAFNAVAGWPSRLSHFDVDAFGKIKKKKCDVFIMAFDATTILELETKFDTLIITHVQFV